MKQTPCPPLVFCIVFILCAVITSLSSCLGKDECTKPIPDEYVYLPEDVKALIPYKYGTKLTFVKTTVNDTHVFYCDKFDPSYLKVRNTAGQCGFNSIYENKFAQFSCPTFRSLQIGIFQPTYGNYYIMANAVSSSYYLSTINMLPYTYDSLLIQNKWYKNVSYFTNQYNGGAGSTLGCYYNTTEGVLKMVLVDGYLELVSIK